MRSSASTWQGNGTPLLAAITGVALFLVLLSACGSGEEDAGGSEDSVSHVSAAGVTLITPQGWVALTNGERGLVIASLEEDLHAQSPQGPRLTVELGTTELPDPQELVGAISGESEGASVEVVEEPKIVQAGVREGVSIGLRESEGGSALISRYVIVGVGGGDVYLIVLEAPENMWDKNVETLEAILASAEFDAS